MKANFSLDVYISLRAFQKIEHWVKMSGKYEVSGLGLVDDLLDDNDELYGFYVPDVFLLEQEVTPGTTEIDDEAIAKLMVELEKAGQDLARLRYWWHLHPKGTGLFWSQTDSGTINGFRNGEWWVSTVFGSSMRSRTRIDLYKPAHWVFDEIDIQIAKHDLGLKEACAEEFKKKVKVLPTLFSRVTTPSLQQAFGDARTGYEGLPEWINNSGLDEEQKRLIRSHLARQEEEDRQQYLKESKVAEEIKNRLLSGEIDYDDYTAALGALVHAQEFLEEQEMEVGDAWDWREPYFGRGWPSDDELPPPEADGAGEQLETGEDADFDYRGRGHREYRGGLAGEDGMHIIDRVGLRHGRRGEPAEPVVQTEGHRAAESRGAEGHRR